VTNLEVTTRTLGDTAVVSLSGELDISVVGQLEQELMVVEEHAPATLLLDLRGLNFIDSSGLRLVLEADLRARKEARRFALVRGPDSVHRVFLIALLDKRLDFVDPPAEPDRERP
jgi:anti-sigma B factor antagonist